MFISEILLMLYLLDGRMCVCVCGGGGGGGEGGSWVVTIVTWNEVTAKRVTTHRAAQLSCENFLGVP